ncbi:MAG: hypothetical protein KF841_16155 [Phycisphaerae bacterium]|nr:hypothetical protein [Phycisphaerae bacterium]
MTQLKIALAAVCLVSALLIFWYRSGAGDTVPDSSESATTWMCRDCGKTAELTAAEAVAAEQAVDGAAPPYICPACSKRELYRTAQCIQCQSYYFSSDVPGSQGRCLHCFPELPTGKQPRANDEAAESEEEPAPPSV